MLRRYLLGIPMLFVALITCAQAEITPHTSYIGPLAGYYTFDDSQNIDDSPVYGLRAGRDFTAHWGAEGVFGYSDAEDEAGNSVKSYVYRLDALYNFMPASRLNPFLAIGGGGTTLDADGSDDASPLLDYGAGLKYSLSDSWNIRGDVRHLIVFDSSDETLDNFEYTLGITYQFGRAKPVVGAPKDSDKDGVVDDKDRCPDTPMGAAVDKDGCPVDSDKDGVADYLDRCQNTPASVSVDKNGCPVDSDKDGVADYLDRCPDTPQGAGVDKDGCTVDSDKDGVTDRLDKCPDTPKGVTVDKDGCAPDADRDTVPDQFDKCPNTPEGVAVDKLGCPVDSDEDGVPDHLDKCPRTIRGVPVDKSGCAPERVSIRLDIKFGTKSSVIAPEYHTEIAKIGDMMNKYPEIKMLIEGHTDNVGNDNYNVRLSENRAQAVKTYLVDKFGIAPSRLGVKGFGPSKPIADNSTPEGRQENRRIEAVIDYTPEP